MTGLRLLLIASIVLTPELAQADQASEAQFHFQVASRHYAARRYRDAIRSFFLVRRSTDSPRVLYSIALCFDLLSRDCRRGDQCERDIQQTYQWYGAYLASGDDDSERRGAATTRLQVLSSRVALVRVESDPPGADILVDRTEIGSYGRTPGAIAVPPGSHRLILRLDGYLEATAEVEAVRGREVTTRIELTRIEGTLRVRSSVGGAITVRDRDSVRVASGDGELAALLVPGRYQVTISAEGHRPWQNEVRVEANGEMGLRVTPVPLPAPTADLNVTANITGAVVHLDGQPAGFTPTFLGGLTVGEHEIRLEHAGVQPVSLEFTLEAEGSGWLTGTLEAPSSTERSSHTWFMGVLGIGALIVGAGTGIGSLVVRGDYDAIAASGMGSLSQTRDTGEALSRATDLLLGGGVLSLAVAVFLYFATEHQTTRASTAVFSRGESR